MKEIFNRIAIGDVNYNVIVNTKYGTTLCSVSGDLIFHTQPLLNSGIEQLNTPRDSGPVEVPGKQVEMTLHNNFRKLSIKRRER